MNLIKELIRFIVFVAIVIAALLYWQKRNAPSSQPHSNPQAAAVLDHKSEVLKNYLTSIDKPQKIEFANLSQRFEQQIQSFKNLKIPQDKNSNFYLSIQFFTDEGDNTAPLVAQIRYIDIKSGNTIKEESINLE